MPELPEVETVKKLLSKLLIKRDKLVVTDIVVEWPKMIKTHSVKEFKELLVGQKLVNIDRYAKHLLFNFEDYTLISHLRMEGKYHYEKVNEPFNKRHTLARITFNDGTELRYHDTRKFGTFHLYPTGNIMNTKPLEKIGPEPFDEKFNVEYLKSKFKNKVQAIKTAILDQHIVAGIGNIYADEILFACKIHPNTLPKDLSDKQLQDIIDNSIIVLNKAIEAGGTTISSFEVSHGVSGKFQQQLKVHQKKDKSCPVCNTIILKKKVNGRGTYYCPNCQKEGK